ncbi:hypothetical protein EC988_001288 [Linderina pennispora]|nr:hypothetical protein EC988_001288 [Linderina pennispora]
MTSPVSSPVPVIGARLINKTVSSTQPLLHRTPSQASFSSSILKAGTATPSRTQPLNETGSVRCIQSLTQRPAGNALALTDDSGDSVLTLAQSDDYVFSGSQHGSIHVWNRDTYQLEKVLHGHTAGCLSLALDIRRRVLFSGGGDGKVRAWDMDNLKCLYVVHAGVNSGAVLSLEYAEASDLLVLGCQNTSIQWFNVGQKNLVSRSERRREMESRRSRFFDDSVEAISVCVPSLPLASDDEPDSSEFYVISESSIVQYAHSGYVYGLLVSGNVLFSAASDGAIKQWQLAEHGMEELAELTRSFSDGDLPEDLSVHALALDDGLLFAGLQSGDIEVWDLETKQRIRVLHGHSGNVYTLLIHNHSLFSGSADGSVRIWGADLQNLGWIASSGDAVLSLAISMDDILISGSSDNAIAFWDVSVMEPPADAPVPPMAVPRRRRGRRMMQALDQWIRFKSVAGVPELQPECRRAARFLKDLMRQLGANDARLISSTPASNPIVYARFDASPQTDLCETPTVFVYGHYDVMPAGDELLWKTQPFELVGRDGYLYGRGVTDNKGPVLATLFAVSELHASGDLPLTVVFCIEGEEENGSQGLHETIASNRALFGRPRLILLSSSYWLGESTPCLTYGMRGSIRANLRIESTRPADVHAGVWGGAVTEPLTCLSHILAQLADPSGHVTIPGFHDSVRPVSDKESAAMRELVQWISAHESAAPLVARTVMSPPESHASPKSTASWESVAPIDARDDLFDQLMRRWRFPTLTVHHVDISTVAARTNTTLIPAAAQASLSVRVVPDQSLEDICQKLRSHVETIFNQMQQTRHASNKGVLDNLRLYLDVHPNAQWWLADPDTPVYQAAARAIREEWQMANQAHVPLLIREGGSIPAVPWLEEFFGPDAIAVNLPMGQSSDNAHLDNERISLVNLVRGRQIVWRLLKDIDQALLINPPSQL